MGWLTTVLPQDVSTRPRELLELVGLPSETERTPRDLSGAASEVVRSVGSVVDDLILRALAQRTAEDFVRITREIFPLYYNAMLALGALIRITVPKRDLSRILAESLSELEADFRDRGIASFGADLRDRGLFTVWVLRKINDLAEELDDRSSATKISDEDTEALTKFAIHAMWARFHIDCLVKSMHSDNPIYPATVDSIVDGLRAGVNAYAWIRQAVDSRLVAKEPELAPVGWGEEDEILLTDSMRDMLHDES